MGAKKAATNLAHVYQHTHIAVYLVGFFAIACLFYDSTQGIVQKYELNRKWFYLYGSGGANVHFLNRGYINFYSLYIGWLCSAVFLHLPSFKALGFDVRTDVSMLLTIFLLSCLVLGALHAIHSLCVFFHLLSPRLHVATGALSGTTSIILLNSMNLAVACSTYYSFCGNAAAVGSDAKASGAAGGFRAAVCTKWLRPINMREHPAFSSWVIYGEGAGVGLASDASNAFANAYLNVDIPLDGIGLISIPAAEIISPVFTLWITLVIMYIVNSAADYIAAAELQDEEASRRARSRSIDWRSRRPLHRRRHSADFSRRLGRQHNLAGLGRQSLDLMQRSASQMMDNPTVRAVSGLLRNFSSNIPETLLAGLPGDLLTQQSRPPSMPQTARAWRPGDSSFLPSSKLDPEQEAEHEGSDEQPDFLPMFPWYSGTSADMYRTIFGLIVSLKLFLGRFDMRTMQAATGVGPPGGGSGPPREGDGFTFEHVAGKRELWIDFCADTGDGGDPTYAVARAMAAPVLHAMDTSSSAAESSNGGRMETTIDEEPGTPRSTCSDSSSGLDTPTEGNRSNGQASTSGRVVSPFARGKLLPRGDVLILGGDLAYPNPSTETYELRFVGPFEAALPPPPGVHPGRLVVNKPDIPLASDGRRPVTCTNPPSSCPTHADLARSPHSGDSRCRACAAAETLRRYDGPTAFAIPGNHDWIDGLETFQRFIHHRGWLGGWLLPQEKSYFALRLPHGWWMFGLDLALVDDIDMCQYRYFARIADERMGPEDQAILVTHQPGWLQDWFHEEAAAGLNLRQLVRGHLRGRARLHLAGDLHFYMRHSFQPAPASEPAAPPAPGKAEAKDVLAPLHPLSEIAPTKVLASKVAAAAALLGCAGGKKAAPASKQSNSASSAASSETDELELGRDIYQDLASFVDQAQAANSKAVGGGAVPGSISANLHPFDPEHLIVNGLGGAFLHPTHVFAPARFASVPDPAADDLFEAGLSPRGRSPKGASPSGASPRGRSPSGASPRRTLSRRGSFIGELPIGKLEVNGGAVSGGGGEFKCTAVYPTPEQSLQIGRQNLHLFRFKNTRFDVIGGAFYFLMVVSVLPRCSRVTDILDAHTLLEAIKYLGLAALDALAAIFTESYLSLIAVFCLYLLCWCMAKGGGYGTIPGAAPPPAPGKRESIWESLALRGRTGGLSTQMIAALAHASAHLTAAILSLVLLELGVETCIRYEELGAEGFHSLYRWYQRFEAQHFPDPAGLRDTIARYTLHAYPGVVQAAMALFDVPEAIAVTRTAMCSATAAPLSRFQGLAYYLGMLAYYWVLVTPSVAFIFGAYLYLSVNIFHVHYDEAFSSLQIPHHKGFSRIHITPEGDLHVYGLAIDQVPCQWREDPRWRSSSGGGSRRRPAHLADYPSRWLPARQPGRRDWAAEGDARIIDRLVIPRKRPF
ncbi:hypothetical protein COCOBI_01-1910 [Coccomyxa sp. Obi]|nr:hypothetical protein COCOBI_01-1910 [Coccomyxa sp. Obi]